MSSARAIGDIDDLEGRLARDATRVPGREVVDGDDLPMVCEQGVHDVRADEARPTRDDRAHIRHQFPPEAGCRGPTRYR